MLCTGRSIFHGWSLVKSKMEWKGAFEPKLMKLLSNILLRVPLVDSCMTCNMLVLNIYVGQLFYGAGEHFQSSICCPRLCPRNLLPYTEARAPVDYGCAQQR